MAKLQTDRFKLPIYHWLILLFLSVGASFIEGNRESYLAPIEAVDIEVRSFDKPKIEYGFVVANTRVSHDRQKRTLAKRISLLSDHLTRKLNVRAKHQTSVSEYITSNELASLIQIQPCHFSESFPDFIS